jgi:hypothetical protein
MDKNGLHKCAILGRVYLFVAVAIGLGVGCETAERIDPSVTTDAELHSSQVLPVALIEFSDWVPQQLAKDLADIPLIRDVQQRVTVLMGDLNNKTGNISSDEFELVRSRIRNSLLQSGYVRDRIKFVESNARMEYLRQNERGLGSTPSPEHDPGTAFALNGDFYRIGRGDTNQYYLEFQLVHFQTNEIVFSKRYDVKQTR